MPLPRPKPDEAQDEFVNRCMGDPEIQTQFGKGSDQAVAVCHQQWRDRDKDKEMSKLPLAPAHLRAGLTVSRPERVDREAAVIYGYNVAEVGVFKDRRGEFNREGLRQAAKLMNASAHGIKSRFSHPTLSDDGLGKFLGRAKSARLEGDQLKADLHLAKSSRNTPHGDLGGYVMDLASEDSSAFGSSLVIEPVGQDGEPLNPHGMELPDAEPQLWFPKRILASDVVDDGDAVHTGFLSVPLDVRTAILRGEFPDLAVRQAAELLDSVFAGQSREVIEARARAWLERYLSLRFGTPPPTPRLDALRERLEALALTTNQVRTMTGRKSH